MIRYNKITFIYIAAIKLDWNKYMLYEIQPTGPARRLATQKVGYDQQGKSTAAAQIAATLGIISQMAPREFNVVLRTTTDEFNVLPRTR